MKHLGLIFWQGGCCFLYAPHYCCVGSAEALMGAGVCHALCQDGCTESCVSRLNKTQRVFTAF